MCGVFGYIGQRRDVGEAVVTALKLLEYRGYDSWGLAIATSDGLLLDKDVGRIIGHVHRYPESTMGLGHTRWATHGGVTPANAHPHLDCTRRVAVVHNGIIENHASLRIGLAASGHLFASETDSEVIAHMVEDRLAAGSSLSTAVADLFALLHGHNAIVVLDTVTGQMVAAKKTSPLVIGHGPFGSTISSDAIALHGHADRAMYLEDDQIAVLSSETVDVLDRDSLRSIAPITVSLDGVRKDTSLGEHPDFLSKEVSEQPEALRRLVNESEGEIAALAAEIQAASRVTLIGCGTAGNAALAGTYLWSQICGRDAVFIPASEYRFRARKVGSDALVIALSQSGETVDVIEAMTEARQRGSRLAAIVNTPHSTLERMVDTRVLLRAGVEQCVLATKSYTAMLATLLLTAHDMNGQWAAGAEEISMAANAIESVLGAQSRERIDKIGSQLATANHLFVIGRGVHYPSALEAALKIKEVSYVHAEGFAAGELKHGVIALIEPGTPCLVFAADDDTRTDVLSSASELRSRGGHIIGIGTTPDTAFDEFIPIPAAGTANPLVEAAPGQLLGYFAALARGNDPDHPRNLAKSVTVK